MTVREWPGDPMDLDARRRVYVVSSWRNTYLDMVTGALHGARLPFFDFRAHKVEGSTRDSGFHWSEIDPDWRAWDVPRFVEAQGHDLARKGFHADMSNLERCGQLLLVLPCGKSAHLEAGFAVGSGRRVVVYSPPGAPFEPELMYGMTAGVTNDLGVAISWLK